MASLKSFLSVIILLAFASHAVSQSNIEMFPKRTGVRPATDRDRLCESWKFSFEAGNAGSGNWTVPKRCVEFVKQYFNGKRYLDDSYVVGEFSYEFAKTVNISSDGKDAWIFDVDETLLSNLPYYEDHGYGSETFNEVDFYVWVEKAVARALPASLRLYKRLQKLGFKIILLTGRDEFARTSTENNLVNAGYSNWEKLILRGPSDQGKKAVVYKSERRAELVKQGYILHGNSGDQWSDLLGYALATRSFKLPNPLYYVA